MLNRRRQRSAEWNLRICRAAVAICWVLLSAAAMAQPLRGTGSISGTVRDASGAVIPDAAVELRNPSRGIRRSTKTGASGTFEVIALDPASGYIVTIAKPGFADQERSRLDVLVGEVTNLEMTLQLTPELTLLSIEASAPAVDQTKTETSQVVRNSQILNLPINGRRVDTYVLLTPAVVPDGAMGLVSFRGIA